MDRNPRCVFCITEKVAARAKKEIPEHLRDEYWALRELVLTKGLMARLAAEEDLSLENMCDRHKEEVRRLRKKDTD